MIGIACRPARVEPDVAALGPAQLFQSLHKRHFAPFQLTDGLEHTFNAHVLETVEPQEAPNAFATIRYLVVGISGLEHLEILSIQTKSIVFDGNRHSFFFSIKDDIYVNTTALTDSAAVLALAGEKGIGRHDV
jgi:hypothetical protein